MIVKNDVKDSSMSRLWQHAGFFIRSNVMQFKLTMEEYRVLYNALDLYSRIWIGQYDHIAYDMRWKKEFEELDKHRDEIVLDFINLRAILMPEIIGYGYYGSHGIYSPERDYRAGVSYDILQEMRYKVSWFEHPEGGHGFDFDKPLYCEDDPYRHIKAECRKENGVTILFVDSVGEQTEIMISALRVLEAENNGNIRAVFSCYTDNQDALQIAEEITRIYKNIPDDPHFNKETSLINELIEKLISSLRNSKTRMSCFTCPFANADVAVPDVPAEAETALCPICGTEHLLPKSDKGRKRIWHRNRNMFMPIEK